MLAGFAIWWWTCGCVHRESNAGRETEATLPKLTALMTGPVANLLTNQAGFESECAITLGGATKSERKISGRIFARGGKLRLETIPGKSKSRGAGEFGVIWDVAASQGFVLSDALQGCAAVKGSVRFTNLLTGLATGQSDRMEGHPVDQVEVTAMGSDGQRTLLQLTRAQDLGDLPLQIRSADEPNSFVLTLSQVRLLLPAEALFQPPDGFTKYQSEPAMLDELAARQQDVFGEGHNQTGPHVDASELERRNRSDSYVP